ncbi:TolC family protein [Methyloversatilis sp.]|uniref:TolC family protein n=1 Tax=Methyloversatilis sp. TaxID=2569862 RepID=UPI002733AD4F|nr:TolC family protein [Methyloversatilis sp.]MDP3289829.1 TolC family protein [Methyloversatilis sp.]MDP3578816.1 TolC family protein [Methyloversatilis sp.]
MLLTIGLGMPALAQESVIGASVDSLLDFAKTRNPEYAAMQAEAEASGQRITPAGALPDPRLRAELMDITKGGEQNPTLSPGRVGSTRYTLMQEVPWFGKRDLKRDIAELEAEAAKGRALGTWTELSARIKTAYAQFYYVHGNERLTREILDLMIRLEKIAQVRYAGGLAAQQDVVRAQVEQTNLRNDLIALENERRGLRARMNALLSRPAPAALAEPAVLRTLPAPAKLDYAALEDRVRARNPLLFVEDARIKAAEKSRELTYKNRYPDFTFGVAPNQFQNSVKQWDLMVEINIPLQQATRRSQERESEAMLTAARSRKEAASNQVLSELSENIASIEAARRTETLVTASLLPQAELTFQAALPGYETGKVDFATLIDALRQIRQAKQNLIKAQAESQARLGEIERLLGEDL